MKPSKILLPVSVLAIGILGFTLMVKLRTPPEQRPKPFSGALVEVLTVEPRDHLIQVRATGTVSPRMEAAISPQVEGTVVEVSPSLVAGGFFSQGEVMFRIDPADFQLALERASSKVAEAEANLATIRAKAAAARSEWEKLRPGEEPPPLAVYTPQLAEAESKLAAARAERAQAELNLERTTLRAPFNCRVLSENIDPGQFIRPGSIVATLIGTDTAQVVVSLTEEETGAIEIPRHPGDAASRALVELSSAPSSSWRWQGWVARALSQVSPKGRMRQVVVEIPDPFSLSDPSRPELAVGSFVRVAISGRTLEHVFAVERRAFHEGDTLWIMDEAGKLRFRKVRVAWRDEDLLLVEQGLSPGERIVLTNLSGAAEGMRLRPAQGDGRP